ncbi:MAG: acyl-[acyl-carrier-protein] thioesterase [Clostridium sp.]|nr:acyl-[acyl-carrier-protein] thioesterase [Clostridium sp.]
MTKGFVKKYEVNYHDVDSNLKCKLSSIINFLCDIGTTHSSAVGSTVEKVKEKGYSWVFYKYDIKMYRYPKYLDEIYLKTTPCGFKKFYAHRKYEITNSKGELLGEAIALFILININKRCPMRIPKEEYELYGLDSNVSEDIKMDDILKVNEENDAIKKFEVRYSDIDSNGHVNNVNYVKWAIESVPLEVFKSFDVERIKVIFEKECVYGDEVSITATLVEENDDITSIHTITNQDGKDLTKLEILWKKSSV